MVRFPLMDAGLLSDVIKSHEVTQVYTTDVSVSTTPSILVRRRLALLLLFFIILRSIYSAGACFAFRPAHSFVVLSRR